MTSRKRTKRRKLLLARKRKTRKRRQSCLIRRYPCSLLTIRWTSFACFNCIMHSNDFIFDFVRYELRITCRQRGIVKWYWIVDAEHVCRLSYFSFHELWCKYRFIVRPANNVSGCCVFKMLPVSTLFSSVQFLMPWQLSDVGKLQCFSTFQLLKLSSSLLHHKAAFMLYKYCTTFELDCLHSNITESWVK